MSQATLGEVIKHLESLPDNLEVREGFYSPHSYRGYYDQLAFEPCGPITVREMLDAAYAARGSTYEGWKGGYFTMTDDTECWLALEGREGRRMYVPRKAPYILPVGGYG